MTKYVYFYVGGGMPETEEESAKVMKAWEDWYKDLGSALVDGGYPFGPMAKSVASDGTVSDGPAGTMSSGYTIVEAASLDDAAEMAKGCPNLLSGGQVSVFETFDVM
jgi:hypothetical protein